MRSKLPFAILAVGALGVLAYLAAPRRTPEAPVMPARPPRTNAVPPPSLDLDPAVQEEMLKLPPAEELSRRAAVKKVPMPPPAKDLTEKDLKSYLKEIIPFERSGDPETAALARQLHLLAFRDFRDRQEELKGLQVQERRDQRLKERAEKVQQHEERRPPRRPRDPIDPRPTQPLVPTPQLGKPYLEKAEPDAESPK